MTTAALRDESDDTDVDQGDTKEAVRRGHLPGMYRFVRERSFEPGTLGAASFWVGLRQEIYCAVTKRQPVCLNLGHPGLIDRSLSETDDYTWANRAVVHCADVLNSCFGPEGNQAQRWDELDKWNRQWSERQPFSYDPVFREPQDMAVFPEIWYHRSCQGRVDSACLPVGRRTNKRRLRSTVIGVQHHRLAKLFLLEHRIKSGSPVPLDERRDIEVG